MPKKCAGCLTVEYGVTWYCRKHQPSTQCVNCGTWSVFAEMKPCALAHYPAFVSLDSEGYECASLFECYRRKWMNMAGRTIRALP